MSLSSLKSLFEVVGDGLQPLNKNMKDESGERFLKEKALTLNYRKTRHLNDTSYYNSNCASGMKAYLLLLLGVATKDLSDHASEMTKKEIQLKVDFILFMGRYTNFS